MNKVLCNAGRNFLIIDNYGDYYKCYSGYSSRIKNDNFKLGNILKDKQINIIKNLECEHNIECNYGCRTGCDYGETIRFDPKTLNTIDIGKQYRLNPIDNVNNIKNELDVYWHVTNYCNMQCIYCNYPRANNNFELTGNEISFIFNKLLEKFDYLYINLTGGEASIHPYFTELCKEIYDNNHKCYLRILTNFSTYKILKNIINWDWPENKLEIWASCHFSEPQFNLEQFSKLCQLCIDKKYEISVSTVDHLYEKKYYKEYFDFFKKIGIKNIFHQFYEPLRRRSNEEKEDFVPKSLDDLHELSKKINYSISESNLDKEINNDFSKIFKFKKILK